MKFIKQGAVAPIMLLLISSTDHLTGLVVATAGITITISKNGAAFAARDAAGTLTSRGDGWYQWTPTATDTNTVGTLAVHVVATGADPTDFSVEIVGVDVADSAAFGLSRLDATVGSRSTYAGADTAGTTTLLARVPSTLVADIATAVWAAGNRTLTGFGTLVADTATAVWAAGVRSLTAFGFTVNTNPNSLETAIAGYLDTEIAAIKANTDKLAELTGEQILMAISGLANKRTYNPDTGVGVVYAANNIDPLFEYTIVKSSNGTITSITPEEA